MTDEKKLTDKELENASGAGPNISSQKTPNRGTYGTGHTYGEAGLFYGGGDQARLDVG